MRIKISLTMILLALLSSCSPGGGGSSSSGPVKVSKGNIANINLSQDQQEAKEVLKAELGSLSEGQYQIESEDLELLAEEGLLTEEELVALKIVE